METISEYVLTFLINAVWQIAIIAAVAALASQLMRNSPASYRHLVWVSALLAAVLLPLSSIHKPPTTTSVRVAIPFPPTESVAHAPVSTGKPPTPPPIVPKDVSFSNTSATGIVYLYLLFVLFRSLRFTLAWIRTVRIKACAEACKVHPPLERVWTLCRDAFGVTRAGLLSSRAISSPLAVGASRPVVIVPESFLTETSEEVLTAALGHELAHIARHDFGANLFYEMLHVTISIHPASWLIRHQIEQTREMACDEAVTSRLLEPRVYARSILHIAKSLTTVSSPGYTLGIFDGSMLEQRIRHLLQRPAASLRRARWLLATAVSTLAVCAVIASGVALTARAQSPFQDHMRQAVDAYNNGDFKDAIEHFTNAAGLEPANSNAKLFLANALMRDFYTQEGPPDTRLLTAARQQYQAVLARDPRNKQAVAGMTALAIDGKQFREAREWAEKLAGVDPNDKTAWYTMGLLDWAIVFPEYQRAKQATGGKPEEYRIPDANVRKNLRDQYLPLIKDGKQMLSKALELDPQYDQAMAYLNLLLRIEAAMWDDPALAEALIVKADMWVTKAIDTKRKRVPEAPESAKLDLDGPPPGPAGRTTMVKAPPPPPPPPSRERSHQIASALPPPKRGPHEIPLPGQYWQVLGASDMRAMDLFLELKGKGFNSAMHAGSDNLVRVVVGPYFDESSIAKAKTSLEMAGFRPIRKWE
jgi:beta-lactamase regulating signal transducer with metallopeptidase domain